MAFKMSGFNPGKGTGMSKTFAKKQAALKQATEVELNPGRKFYTGGDPTGKGYVSQDDPRYYELLNDPSYSTRWVGDPETNIEYGATPGEDLSHDYESRADKYKSGKPVIAHPGKTKSTTAAHEGYPGVKDASAGYDKFTLGQPNEKEKHEKQRFSTDLNKNLRDYRGKLPIGDWDVNEKNFDHWKKLNNATGPESDLKNQFEKDAIITISIERLI